MPSLYVHIPFCQNKCDYCSFFSVPVLTSDLLDGYLHGIKKEIALRQMEAPEGVSSLFLGGGTPTALSAEELNRLLKAIHEQYIFNSKSSMDIEKTTEANPGTFKPEKLDVLRLYGINRISLGAQSFNDNLLKRIGRIHTVEDIGNSIKMIRKSGIKNLNLDLMFGLPGQTLFEWKDTLKKAVTLTPEHLSLYALTVEPGTPLSLRTGFKSENRDYLPDDDLQADMYAWAANFLGEQGYCHYEISNYARPGFECRHNYSTWQGEDYIGLGPGAVSCLCGVRSKNMEDICGYIEKLESGIKPIDITQTEILTVAQRISEYVMLGFRTLDGIDTGLFAVKFGEEFQDIYGQILTDYLKRGILQQENGRIRVDPSYYFILNSIVREFII